MIERHFPPAVGEFAARQLAGRRKRDRLVEEVVGASRELAGFVDLEIPSAAVCPSCAPVAPGEYDAAKLRLHDALEELDRNDAEGGADAR